LLLNKRDDAAEGDVLMRQERDAIRSCRVPVVFVVINMG